MPRMGINFDAGARAGNILSPCPYMIDYLMIERLHYTKCINKKDDSPRYVRYTRSLNAKDNPINEALRDISCVSYITIDIYSGAVTEAYLKIDLESFLFNKRIFSGEIHEKSIFKEYDKITSYSQLPDIYGCNYVFRWHANIVHMAREWIKGGWLTQPKVIEEIEKNKNNYIHINNPNRKGNLLEKAKPTEEEFK